MSRRAALAVVGAGLVAGFLWTDLGAARLGYPPAEFQARRQALAKELKTGAILLFGRTTPPAGIRFRQDNDFFYLTGNEDLNAALLMDAASGSAVLFLPHQTPGDIRALGRNWLEDAEAGKPWGFTAIRPLEDLPGAIARLALAPDPLLWTRLSPGDEADINRGEQASDHAKRLVNLGGGHLTEDASRAAVLRAQFPSLQLRDVAPALDAMRTIKSAREIEILRENGRISAEAIRRAILATREGGFEYEIEAEATHWMFRNGIQGNSFPPIVGSGPNVNVWHYQRNGRQYKDGDLVVMDYGGALDYLGVDITRTWPVSGSFDDLQRRAYDCALEAQKAIIAAMKPGATRAQTAEIGAAVYKKHGFPGRASAGHYVGMSVHDVGDGSLPFRPGMVIAVEPIVEDAAKQLHVRIEDTVLITEAGPEVLTSGVPKEAEGVLALVREARTKNAAR
ncbi:MAG: aminopeptidase family protein [Acidobacteria bacterium]|nr:aminopeptidase family protein [Acidobacteriota bacterium]